VYRDARPSTDVVIALRHDVLEELLVLRDADAPRVQRFHVQAAGIDGLSDGRWIEAVDATGRIVVRTTPAFAIDAKGSGATST
jgi:hypothetical protein